MLDNEKLLFDELYEKTKDCGRVQFVKLLMTKERENKELKLQLKGTTHCFDEEEHEKLKKQLENCYCNRTDCSGRIKDSKVYDSLVQKVETQQKEFIEYLEDEIKRINPKNLYISELNLMLDDIKFTQYLIYKEILQKYKEMIGDDK